VPAGTVLDSWEGRTFVSLVGFRFLDTRVLGLPVPFHRHFDEVNLRFYVRREHPDGPRRGVVFVKEIVPRRAIAWLARTLYGENYIALPMRHDVEMPHVEAPGPGHAAYEWRFRGRWQRLAATVDGPAAPAAPGSQEEFITEHYWGYARRRGDTTVEYQVEHPRWRVWRATAAELRCDVAALYGPEFAEALSREPSSAFVADGSMVTVRRGARLR
jgi:hypothetical protein